MIHSRPGGKFLRLEAYGTDSVLRRLQREWGGRLERIDTVKIAARANAPRRPLRLARDLAVIDAHGSWPATQPEPRFLLRIGGAMAFGTGEHATTSACLRFLREEAGSAARGWSVLDIGTGSGILAIAAEKLGAARVEAFDCDHRAVAAAQANLRRNGCRRVRLAARDLLRWQPRRRHPVVLANVFSEILRIAAAPIAAAVQPGGCLILSGILLPQERETLTAFLDRGLVLQGAARRGKWVTLRLRAPAA